MTAQDLLASHTKHRLTAEEFVLLDEAGAFGGRRTELFGGDVYYINAKHRPHARVLTQMIIALDEAMETANLRFGILTDISVRLSDNDVPEPDLVVTDAPEGDGVLPGEAAKLVVEIADSTVATDLRLKARLYAEAGVTEYWVVDLPAASLHQFWSPSGSVYGERREIALGARVVAATLPGPELVLPTS